MNFILPLFLSLLLVPSFGFAAPIEYKIDHAIYRVRVHVSGGIAKYLWETELKNEKTEHDYSEGGSTYDVWQTRSNKTMSCVRMRQAISGQIDFFCRIFAPNLSTETNPIQAVLSLGNFHPDKDKVNLTSTAVEVPKGFKSFVDSEKSTIDGVTVEGDFAEKLLEDYLKDVPVKPNWNNASNAKEVTKEKGNLSCTKLTVSYEGQRVRTEFHCYLKVVNRVQVIPQGNTFSLDDDGNLKISK